MTLTELRKRLPREWQVSARAQYGQVDSNGQPLLPTWIVDSNGQPLLPTWIAEARWPPTVRCPTCGHQRYWATGFRTDKRHRTRKEAVAALAQKLDEIGVLK